MQKTVPGFDYSAGLPMMAIHTFAKGRDGQLEHSIDGKLRAQVPPEGWADYCREYPEAQDIVDAMTIKPTTEGGADDLAQKPAE